MRARKPGTPNHTAQLQVAELRAALSVAELKLGVQFYGLYVHESGSGREFDLYKTEFPGHIDFVIDHISDCALARREHNKQCSLLRTQIAQAQRVFLNVQTELSTQTQALGVLEDTLPSCTLTPVLLSWVEYNSR
jgi:hypothetical protein